MAQEIIDVGSTPNDGNGDPLRTAFLKTKNNFSELYSTYATTTYVNNQINTQISNLINFAPEALDTLGEIATALSNENDIVNTLFTTVGGKANTTDLATVAFSGSYNDLTNKPVVTTGYTGSIGFTGSQGTAGATGFTGSIGFTGSTGISTNTTIATAKGSPGDTQFKVAVDNTYIYYCTANYDGSTNVWKRVAFSMDTW